MKRLIYLTIMFTLLPARDIYRANGLTNGVAPYSQKPIEVTRGGEVSLLYVTNELILLNYYYEVRNANNTTIVRTNTNEKIIWAGETLVIAYFAAPGTISVGANRLILTFKTQNDPNVRTHIVTFYGYVAGANINLNNHTTTDNHFYNEIEYIYHGYERGTIENKRTSFKTTNLDGSIYFATDLYFDFTALYFSITGNYVTPFYKDAVLYFKDPTLFPYLSRVSGEAALELKLDKNGNNITFSPLRRLYVDVTNHHMRTEPRVGYVNVDKLYFPRASYGSVNLTQCRFEVKGFGFHEANLVYDFHLEIGMPFLRPGGSHEVIIIRS